MANYLYLRGLKQVDYTVFGVANGQKHYYSPLNNRPNPSLAVNRSNDLY